MSAGPVAVQDGLSTCRIALLCVDGGTRHMRNSGVPTAPRVLRVSEWVVLGSRLWEPDITTIAAEVAGFDSLCDVLLDDNGTTSSVNEPRARFHLRNELLVKQALGLLVQWAIDCDDVALGEHLLEILDAATANLLLNLRAERLVVVVQQFLAVEGFESAQDTLPNATNGNGANNLILQIVLILSNTGDVPVTTSDHLMSRHEVAHKSENGHNDMLSD